MLRPARRFGLSLDSTGRYPSGTEDTFWLHGRRYTQAMLDADWHEFGWSLFHRVGLTAPWPTSYQHFTPAALRSDHLSVAEWIDTEVPGGLASDFGRLCYLDAESEYGGPPEEQSALNLIYMLTYNDSSKGNGFQSKRTPLLAGTDEKWHVHGGNDQIIAGMVAELPAGTILTGQRLVAIRERRDRTYACTFDVAGVASDVVADHVVLAIPFNKLSEVDLTRTSLSSLKRTAIATLTLGNNAKVALQVAGNPWNADGYTGNIFSDNGTAGGWDITSYQPGPTAVFLDYLVGVQGSGLVSRYGLVADTGTAPAAMVDDDLARLEPVFPGITAAWAAGPRLGWYADGNIDVHIGGSYSQYRVGQYTGLRGIEGAREGNIHFAGEHNSQQFQGFMEGAVTSGERVASEI